jgi:antitoxin component YwqK of YwqJK toxin-antitoxin module
MKMKKYAILFSTILVTCSLPVFSQNLVSGTRVKTITECNTNNKMKETDHVTNFTEEGLKLDEIEYFSDGMVKTKTVYEYDSKQL